MNSSFLDFDFSSLSYANSPLGVDFATSTSQLSVNSSRRLSYLYKNGDVYEGTHKNGKKQGYGIYFFNATGDRYSGNFVAGKQNGFGIYYLKNGDIYEGNWLNGLINGHGIVNYTSGYLFNGTWKNSVRHGYGIVYKQKKGIQTIQDKGYWENGKRVVERQATSTR